MEPLPVILNLFQDLAHGKIRPTTLIHLTTPKFAKGRFGNVVSDDSFNLIVSFLLYCNKRNECNEEYGYTTLPVMPLWTDPETPEVNPVVQDDVTIMV
jgi:hypothetical protein